MSTTIERSGTVSTVRPRTDRVVAIVSGGMLAAFVVAAIAAPANVSAWVDTAFTASAAWFGFYWQILLLATFLVAIVLAVVPWSSVRMGGLAAPEYDRFKWMAMIMCTLLAGGGVFWAAAEPMYHFLATPPFFGEPATPEARAASAMAQTFTHWGFLAWAILGALGSIVMLYAERRGMPLRPRTLLYPVMGERVRTSWIGSVVDVVCILAVAAGTIGPIGFLGLQVAYGMSTLLGTPNSYGVQLAVIAVLTAVAVTSVATGIDKGIQFLSRLNVWLAVVLMILVLAVGSLPFVAKTWVSGLGSYATNFFGMSLYRGDEVWLAGWTVFFFGWFLGYGPLMAIFIARISRGRTARDLLLSVAVGAPIATTLWFSVLGGTGIWIEQNNPGAISGPLDVDGLPAAVIAISQNLPLAGLLGIGFLILTITFVATTTDSMAYAVAQACTTDDQPATWLRALWAVIMGAAAATLISIGDGGISALQSFIVVTAVPVGFVMLPSLFAAPLLVRRLAAEEAESARLAADMSGPDERDVTA